MVLTRKKKIYKTSWCDKIFKHKKVMMNILSKRIFTQKSCMRKKNENWKKKLKIFNLQSNNFQQKKFWLKNVLGE